ncbi:MAG: hypothetical protein ACOYL6_12540 [Bacteriovoracaceae bacterium]
MKCFLFFCLLLISFALFAAEDNLDSTYNDRRDAIEVEESDRAILEAGPVTRKKYVAGGITGTVLGFGAGHAMVGKWKEAGWYYTAAELGFLSLMMIGHKKSLSDTLSTGFNGNFDGSNYALMITGYVGFISARIGEIFDVWNRPYEHNLRYKELTKDNPLAKIQFYPLVSPQNLGLGLAYAF